jgi:Zn-dependent protease
MSRKENGIISASGPAVNLLLCALFAVLVFAAGGISGIQNGNLIAIVGLAGIQINAMLAGFNLIPISILDGRKVFAWNIPVFLVMAAAAFGTLYLSFTVV